MERIVVVFNPRGGSAERAAIEAALCGRARCELVESDAAGAARGIAHEAALAGYTTVVAAGGDGTISEIVDGLMAAGAGASVRLAVVPLGTGNDLARTLALPAAPADALALLDGDPTRERRIDVIAVEVAGAPRTYAVNCAAGGLSGAVDETLDSDVKARWGPFAYVIGAARALAHPEVPDIDAGWDVELTVNGAAVERHRLVNLLVANGRTIGGGRRVAPSASLEDGLLDLVLVKAGSRVDLAAVGARLLAGRALEGDAVFRRRVRTVRVVSDPALMFNVDGDSVPRGDVAFSVVPRALRVVVGPTYQAVVSDDA